MKTIVIVLVSLLLMSEAQALMWLDVTKNIWYGNICRNGKYWEMYRGHREGKPVGSQCYISLLYDGQPILILGTITTE
jgi:hypothetical protein